MDPTARFAALVHGPEDLLAEHLDEAALLIAAHARPDLDVDAYRRRLDELGARCHDATLSGVIHQLFVVEGFRGNADAYGDPRNSYLDQVLDRRVGIPITLSIVLIEVSRRLGLPVAGVSMPGHFLTRLAGEPAVLIDAFDGGRLLSKTECQQRFREQHGPAAPWEDAYLAPVGARAIVSRVLANLRTIHLRRQDTVALDWVLRLRSLLGDPALDERAERAGVLASLAQFDKAAALLEELAGEAADDQAMALTSRARRLRARLN